MGEKVEAVAWLYMGHKGIFAVQLKPPKSYLNDRHCKPLMTVAQHERIVAGLEAERDSLRAFAQDVMEGWPYGAPDGGDLQELAEKLGLLKPVEMAKPCAEECCCAEFYGEDDGPFRCYRKTSLLTGNPESNRNIDAFLAQTAEGVKGG